MEHIDGSIADVYHEKEKQKKRELKLDHICMMDPSQKEVESI